MKKLKENSVRKEPAGLSGFEDAVSRAYYSMFHAAKAALASEEVYQKTYGTLRELA